jgi:hypothetical protein
MYRPSSVVRPLSSVVGQSIARTAGGTLALPSAEVRPHRAPSASVWKTLRVPTTGFIFFLLAHVVLAMAMERYRFVATAHALFCWLGGIACAFAGMRRERIVMIAGYIAASEVLWRAAEAQVFYEGGKYAIAAIFLASMLRLRLYRLRWPAILYFLLLLPSIVMTMGELDLALVRGVLSFNLSGPLALAMSVLYLSQVRLTPAQLLRVLGIMLGPLIGLAAVCSSATFGVDDIQFTANSNYQTSAGAGPNQVSSVLGWGVTCAFLWLAFQRRSLLSAGLALGLMLVCAVQAALTFSRSGIWMSGICILAASCFLARDPRTAAKMAVLFVFVALLGWFVIVPALDHFTGGTLSERYAQKGFSNRENIAQQDLLLFAEHPILGVGPGMGKSWRKKEFGSGDVAHTEFTRLFSEHGILGFTALLSLLAMAGSRFLAKGSPQEKALRGTSLIYSFAFMAVTAMRVALPGFVFGLAFVGLALPNNRSQFSAARHTNRIRYWPRKLS